jgi:hypothetical protein
MRTRKYIINANWSLGFEHGQTVTFIFICMLVQNIQYITNWKVKKILQAENLSHRICLPVSFLDTCDTK